MTRKLRGGGFVDRSSKEEYINAKKPAGRAIAHKQAASGVATRKINNAMKMGQKNKKARRTSQV